MHLFSSDHKESTSVEIMGGSEEFLGDGSDYPCSVLPENRNPSPGCFFPSSWQPQLSPSSQALTRYFPSKVFSGSAFHFSQAKVAGVTW